jgi:hypothetical protein
MGDGLPGGGFDYCYACIGENRETGGSIPAGEGGVGAKSPRNESAEGAEPPVLNKSGGSDVE